MGRHREPEPTRTWHQFPELPPKPDPATGEPFPPHAPGFSNEKGLAPEHDPARSTRLSHKPKPPEGSGPVLAWHRSSRLGNIRGFLVAFAIMAGASIVMFILVGDLGAVGYWQLWVLMLVFAYLMSSPLDYQTTSVGADWIKWDYNRRWYQRRARHNHLKTYELTRVEGYFAGGMLHLRFEDLEGRGADRQVGDLQRDRRIWDLFYNGLLHSVANGARINQVAIELLKLNETPALRLRNKPASPQDDATGE
jgi:hypothetical protein